MTDDIYETPSTTPNFQTELAAQLADLMPEAIADGKVDVEKLKELLSSDAADNSERFGLFWPGKKRALRAAQEPTTATLKPDFENSKDWDTTQNVFIEGDNLEVLKILQKHYHAKINLIYIDPPYNTGKDFIYPDNYKEGLSTYLAWSRQVNDEGKKLSTNAETEGRYHSNWLNMMYPRLKLARNLLADDGAIFISIDDSEFANLKKLTDEIFGEANFIATLAIEMSKTQGMKVAAAQNGQIVKNHEYVLVYARSAARALSDRRPLYDASELYDSHYDVVWESGASVTALSRLLEGDPRSVQAFNRFGLRVGKPDLKTLLSLDADYLSYFMAEIAPKLYRESPISLDSIQNMELETGVIFQYQKYLLRKNSKGTVIQLQPFLDGVKQTDDYSPVRARATIRGALWKGFHSDMMNVGKEGGVEFKNGKKPTRLVKQIIKWVNRRDGIVLDFFAGSGTSAEATLAMNAEDGGSRSYILVQLPEPISNGSTVADLTRKRIGGIRLAPTLERAVDTGYRSYKLVDTNFSKWHVSSDVEYNTLEQHLLELRDSSSADDATPDSLLTEVLLKQGYSLTEKISSTKIEGLDVRVIGDNLVIAYLDEHVKPTLEQLRAIVDADPQRIIALEDAFQGDDELKTNLAQLTKSKGIELWTA
ncbi:site-specific DNA-methyltransferase [Citricoccus sp. NPDC079358]|uniref:site-specific DNA-methyltransferase n=1 Tax=Citricoccus sp. NPDC079358 TaxID=3154653 RepID=UPI003450BBE0